MVRTLAVVGLVALLVLSGVGPADRSEPTPIDACTTISDPGRYAVTADLRNVSAGQCIRIRASDVAIEGGGHLVEGTGAFGTAGIAVGAWGRSVSNVTIRNLTVSEWDDAVRLTEANRGALANVTATESRVGVRFYSASGNHLDGVRATDNAVHGLSLADDSDGNRAENVTATGNALFGVHFGADSSGNAIWNVTARRNEYGVVAVGADRNRVVGGSATGNRLAGVWLSTADGNLVADLRLENRFYGVFLADGATNNTLRRNRAEDTAVGFRLRNSDGNLLRGNLATGGRDGLLLIESDRNSVVENRVTGNRRGVSLLASSDNRFRANVVRDNRRNFVVARGSENNSVSTLRNYM
ncbi:right-handed parallel beta-helix repeat-containing protein [Halorussus lipolyticus]|uniref:right-handed parallel beta-helix repeat-containing protein n=1 Tax=Halorussus lipolyticus TaxID=3034024 RepID=UPI0023E86CA0|nr:NosD domain-containing protein [Halorussus sp. DT80]